ncbi:CCA tRNA nucleotidyltransferase [Devosia sp. 66-22]|uniref:CCA tRNA nucleotidyltransferase n=1 Tax=Devosia sp. 66-22 TaxID=1895753 RepID=UPI000B21BC18|nr:CCA tRNA nucleotidyltransferase [Devosia sp. 66-22]
MIAKAALQRLKDAPWLRDPATQKIFALLDGERGKTRAVGGAIRDTLVDHEREATEIDFATELLPREVMRRAGEAGVAAYPTGIEHGTITLKVDDRVAEVTTLREDIETDGRHAVVRFGWGWTRDAERRDFTMNALYSDMEGELFDPINGVEDCLSGAVRFIGDANKRIAEDKLRVYRFFRFTASHGHEQFDEDGLVAVHKAAGDLHNISAERVGNEMRRMLALPRIARTLETMAQTGVLNLPPDLLERMGTYERRAHKPNTMSRMALLVQSLGSKTVKKRWRLSNDEIGAAEAILLAAKLITDFRINEAAYRFPAHLSDAVEVAATFAGWTEAGKSAIVEHLRTVDVPKFPVSGNDLLQTGMRPGPRIGAELDRLEQKWIQSGFKLDRNALLSILQR